MRHTEIKILGQLHGGTGRLTLTLAEVDTAWNPAATNDLQGPAKVTYTLRRDGGIDCLADTVDGDVGLDLVVESNSAGNVTIGTIRVKGGTGIVL